MQRELRCLALLTAISIRQSMASMKQLASYYWISQELNVRIIVQAKTLSQVLLELNLDSTTGPAIREIF